MLLPLGSFSFYSFVKFGFDHLSARRLIGTSEMRTFLCITFGIALLQGSNDCLGVLVARRLSAALFFFFMACFFAIAGRLLGPGKDLEIVCVIKQPANFARTSTNVIIRQST